MLSNVVSNEQNVRDILTKVSLGEADAGFVYITDAKTVPGKVNTIFLPGWAQPHVKYEIAVVTSSSTRQAAGCVHRASVEQAGAEDPGGGRLWSAEGDGHEVAPSRSKRLFSFGLFLATGIAALFLLLPLARDLPPGPARQADRPARRARRAETRLLVTLKTNAIAMALILLIGTPTAYLIGTRRFRGRKLALTLVELPLVLPPAVAGIGLLAAFGRVGLLGTPIQWLGVQIPFTQIGRRDGDHVRRQPLLPAPGHRRIRGARPEPGRRSPHARAPRRRVSSSASRFHSHSVASALGQRSPSPAASASSARRSCSRAASKA